MSLNPYTTIRRQAALIAELRDSRHKLFDQLDAARSGAEHQRLRALVIDLAEYGLRCDLNPTLCGNGDVYRELTRYLHDNNESIRDRAVEALGDTYTRRRRRRFFR